MLNLSNLQPAKGSQKKKKRLGRGSASRGDYSGRGIKGQKARSGVSGLKQKGVKEWLMKVPKQRGFKSRRTPYENVSLADLNRFFKDGDKVTERRLYDLGLVKNLKAGVKILANGVLQKKLQVIVHAASSKAKAAIEEAGGTVKLIAKPTEKKQNNSQTDQGQNSKK